MLTLYPATSTRMIGIIPVCMHSGPFVSVEVRVDVGRRERERVSPRPCVVLLSSGRLSLDLLEPSASTVRSTGLPSIGDRSTLAPTDPQTYYSSQVVSNKFPTYPLYPKQKF